MKWAASASDDDTERSETTRIRAAYDVVAALRTGVRGQFPTQAPATGDISLSAPTTIGGGPSAGGAGASGRQVVGDDQQIAFTTGDAAPAPGEAHVYRVTASQQGQVFGGYTVVLLG